MFKSKFLEHFFKQFPRIATLKFALQFSRFFFDSKKHTQHLIWWVQFGGVQWGMPPEVDPLGCLEQMEMETKAPWSWEPGGNRMMRVIHKLLVSKNLKYLKETHNIIYIYISICMYVIVLCTSQISYTFVCVCRCIWRHMLLFLL